MKLTRPITAHGEQRTELTFREPTGADIARDGLPFKFEGESRVMDTASLARHISSLGGIPPSAVGNLCALDFMRATGEILGFFADAETPPPSSATTFN